MPLAARNTIHDFTMDLDFAARHVLTVAGPAFAPIWTDLDKGTGHVAVAGIVNGFPLIRFHNILSEVSLTSIPVDRQSSNIEVNGRVVRCSPAGQVVLDNPVPDIAATTPALAKARDFLPQVLRGYEVLWLRQGTTWPVALVRKKALNTSWWSFVHIPTYLPDVQRAIVEITLNSEQLKYAMPSAERPRVPGF